MINKNMYKKLDYLFEKFNNESGGHTPMPESDEEKKYFLRGFMNVRPPRVMNPEVLEVQDEYLIERADEKGIVSIDEIDTIKKSLNSSNPYADSISVWQGDITRLKCDAIVNAANSQMLGCFIPNHTCIDNSIHTFAGVQLRLECNRQMNELRKRFGDNYERPTGEPLITDAYNLPAKKIIHVVGPIVNSFVTPKLKKELSNCYKNTLELCLENGLRSVAFCCISTGVFRFPNDKAAQIAVNTVSKWLNEHEGTMDKVVFNVFKDLDKELYEKILSE